jgi:general stress protein 26
MTSPVTSDYPGLSLTLTDVEQVSWQHLASVFNDKDDKPTATGFKTMILASRITTGATARTVVLRKVDIDRKYVWFHTDVRAAKVMQLEAFPDATLLFWDDTLNVQLRLTVETHLHSDDYVADEHWKAIGVGNRKNYLSEFEPGSERPSPYPGFPTHLGSALPSPEESEVGRKNFAVIECRVLAMDYLQLSRNGQVRAQFLYEPEYKMIWLAP